MVLEETTYQKNVESKHKVSEPSASDLSMLRRQYVFEQTMSVQEENIDTVPQECGDKEEQTMCPVETEHQYNSCGKGSTSNLGIGKVANVLKFSNNLCEIIMQDVYHHCMHHVLARNKPVGWSPVNAVGLSLNGVQRLRGCKPLPKATQNVEGHENDNDSLCDTFLDSLFKQDCSHSTASSSDCGITKLTVKSKKMSRKEKKRKKLLKKLPPAQHLHSFAEMGFWTAPRTETDASEALGCPVCFEVFFNPYSCVPCKHCYCEPCLRRMAKYNTDRKRSHRCPICRVIITRCVFNQEIHEQVLENIPEEYQRRGKCEASNRYMKHPLPFTPKIPDIKTITNAISERQRNQEMREHAESYWKMVLTTAIFFCCKGLVILGLAWFFSLFSEDGFMSNAWDRIWEHLYVYGNLDANRKADISNHVFISLLGLFLICSMYSSIVRNGIQNRRL